MLNTNKISRSLFAALPVALALLCLPCLAFAQTQKRIVGYYPAWMRSTLPADKVDFANLTHIDHAFAWPKNDGSIAMYADLLYPELVDRAHDENVGILISMGGFGQSDGFAPMAADSITRAKFIENVVAFIDANDYNGIDLDWEFPATAIERNNLTKLVQELRQAFDTEGADWLITMAVNPSAYYGQYHDYVSLQKYVDWFSIMAFDFHGSWTNHAGHNAPLYAPPTDFDGSAHQGVQYVHSTRGVPKAQIILGMPFYGREFNASALYGPSTGGDLTHTFSQIIPKITSGWTCHWDDLSKVPYLFDPTMTKLITFDDTVSIRIKSEYILENELAGAMIWALGQDVIEDTQPLLETIGRTFRLATGIHSDQSLPVQSFKLLSNYPNPFNPETMIRFQLPANSEVRLAVYSLTGRLVRTLVKGQRASGMHSVVWDATDDVGEPVSSGIYFYRLRAGDFVDTKRMLLLR